MEGSAQEIRWGGGPHGDSYVGLDILLTDGANAVPCGVGTVNADVVVSVGGAAPTQLASANIFKSCTGGVGSFAIVADNSGSQAGVIDNLRTAVTSFSQRITDLGGKTSLVRVSTESEVLVPLTGSMDELQVGIDAMFVNHGWTALYDGLRLGNETLGGVVTARDDGDAFHDIADFCAKSEKVGIVAFTNGRENNSAHQSLVSTEYPGDGIDTTVDDVKNLNINGISTPLYLIGLGKEIDQVGMADFASVSGGRALFMDDPTQVPDAFALVNDYVETTNQICARMPENICGPVEVTVNWSWKDGTRQAEGSRTYEINIDCHETPTGRAVTILATLSNPEISAHAQTLAFNSMSWVSSVQNPHILVIRDDNHHGEAPNENTFLQAAFAHIDATFIAEPASGIELHDLTGYDIVWLSNPGYPVDDKKTFDALKAFQAQGGSVIIQGDDMANSMASSFSMSDLTRLKFVNNGTKHCGVNIDNNGAGRYDISFAAGHPVSAGLEGLKIGYGDDIDVTTPLGLGEHIIATAEVRGKEGKCAPIPVVVGYDPDDVPAP
ncbi:MAG: hypothetical protein IPL79_15465 [Myxococcales bacterium]|nr:hypothetical protein [Myxococcales bacterium]